MSFYKSFSCFIVLLFAWVFVMFARVESISNWEAFLCASFFVGVPMLVVVVPFYLIIDRK